jgi:hypothetical protein
MNNREKIKLEALDLGVGESKYCRCVFCDADHKDTFYITRISNGILYICYRASCGERGFIPSINYRNNNNNNRKFVPRPFTKETKSITDNINTLLQNRYSIDKPDWRLTLDEECLVIPLKTAEGIEWGTQTKRINPVRGAPKSVTYRESEFPAKLHFPRVPRGGYLYAVEDPISAERVPESVALLGTDLKQAGASYLVNIGITRLILALDYDALNKAYKIKQKYSLLFKDGIKIQLWGSRRDPKDMPNKEFKEVFCV